MNERSKPTLAVVGATGAVGSVLLKILSEREDVWGEIRLLASSRSAGRVLQIRGEDVTVRELDGSSFEGVDVAIFDLPDDVAEIWAPVAVERGVTVIDNSGAFRLDPLVPLVVPEVNPAQMRNRPRGIIANPNCTTLTMMDVLGPLHAGWELAELVVTACQAASGAGQAGMARLRAEADALAGQPDVGTHTGGVRRRIAEALPGSSPFPAPLAYNVIPFTGVLREQGWSSEELKVRNESRKILGIPDLRVSATCIRVPVINGHSLAVHARFRRRLTADEVREALVQAPNVVVLDDPERAEWPTPTDVVGSNPTFVGRIRQALDFPDAIELFLCGDNLRKGAALNAAQIGEELVREMSG